MNVTRHHAGLHDLPQGLPSDKFHADEGSRANLAGIVNRDDGWMAQRRSRARFLFEPVHAIGIVRDPLNGEWSCATPAHPDACRTAAASVSRSGALPTARR